MLILQFTPNHSTVEEWDWNGNLGLPDGQKISLGNQVCLLERKWFKDTAACKSNTVSNRIHCSSSKVRDEYRIGDISGKFSEKKKVDLSFPEWVLLDSGGSSLCCDSCAALGELPKPLQGQVRELTGISWQSKENGGCGCERQILEMQMWLRKEKKADNQKGDQDLSPSKQWT